MNHILYHILNINFSILTEKHETGNDDPPIKIYNKRIENRNNFQIMTRSNLELLTPETIKSTESNEIKITEKKKVESKYFI